MNIQALAQRLLAGSIENPVLEARLLLAKTLNISLQQTYLLERNLALDEIQRLEELLSRRLSHEPMAYIVGEKEFYSLTFQVNSSTLIPRPDSESLIELALPLKPNTIIDIGTGTGALIITLLKHLPKASGLAIDISHEALKVAAQNAKLHQVQERLKMCHTSYLQGVAMKADLIISNPPYIATSSLDLLETQVKDFEPLQALDGGVDGLEAYRAIFKMAQQNLNESGYLLFEVGFDQARAVKKLGEQEGYALKAQKKDLNGHIRALLFTFSAKPPFQI